MLTGWSRDEGEDADVGSAAAPAPSLGVLAGVLTRVSPPWAMAVGALAVSSSAIFLDLSGSSPGTATFYRCLFAVAFLTPLAIWERRRGGTGPSRQQLRYAVVAGALFTGDALWWTQSIGEVGAGLSTVLVNAQVVLVPLLALAVDRERVTRLFLALLPVMSVGIVLAGGVWEGGVGGTDPAAGTGHALLAAVCYTGFLHLLRRGGGDRAVVQTYQVVVATVAVVTLLVGPFWGDLRLAAAPRELAWLVPVALASQVVGWLLVALASPLLRPEVGAALLLLTPVGALALAAIVLGERPSPLQLLGCVLVLVSAYAVSARRGGPRPGGRRA
jgi:drug/metabolite transporter (DMT)-like permease